MDAVHQDGTEQSTRLLEQIRQLQALSNRVSEDANNLARAIQGDAKRQGDWGELLIERLFEASGLQAGRDYEGQRAFRTEDGSLRRTDFIVHLPGEKAVIVDAKVSLTAFDRYSAARDDALRSKALAEHVQSVRQHVAELQAAGYEQLLGNRTLDFVLLCIPLEPAFQAALQADATLLYDLGRTNVVVAGPTTLLLSLKLIAQLWRREHENQNAELIAERAGRLYDQVALVIEAAADAQKRLSAAAESFDLVQKRLQEGRGNLVGRIEALRRLGAKVSKPLPAGVVRTALQEVEDPDVAAPSPGS